MKQRKIGTLSIIVPVFNEEKTIYQVLENLKKINISDVKTEVIVVDDGSNDKTNALIKQAIRGSRKFKFFEHKKNQGKGKAVVTGIQKAKGDYIIIQDADLEYNPMQIAKLVKPVLKGEAIVVYGTRINRMPNLKGEEKTGQFLLHYFGNRFLSIITSALYFQWITDMETCYKLFPKKALAGVKLNARGFELEPEITAKLLKKGFKIFEVPIKTNPRGYDEGKKLHTVRDGSKALYYLFKYRFTD